MDKEYTIKSAMKTGEYDGKFGKMFKYAIQVDGEANACELSQKPETPAPKVGDKIFGSIETTNYGNKFKKSAQGGFSKGSFQKSDPNTMLISYAKDIVVAFVAAGKIKEEKEASNQITNFSTLFRGIYNILSNGENPIKKSEVVTADDGQPIPEEEEVDIEDIPF